jgi:hypothetical protein
MPKVSTTTIPSVAKATIAVDGWVAEPTRIARVDPLPCGGRPAISSAPAHEGEEQRR